MLFFLHTTYQQPCCAALRGSHIRQPVIYLHTEQPAHTTPHQLHSIPGMALSLTQALLWSSCPSKRHRQKEQQRCIHVYVCLEGNGGQRNRTIKAPLWIWQLVYSMQGWRATVSSTHSTTIELIYQVRDGKLPGNSLKSTHNSLCNHKIIINRVRDTHIDAQAYALVLQVNGVECSAV